MCSQSVACSAHFAPNQTIVSCPSRRCAARSLLGFFRHTSSTPYPETVMPDQSGDSAPVQAKKRRRKVWSHSQREEILRSTAGRCYSCGLPMGIADDWWVEHIIPHSLGGSDDTDNLLPSCRLCNFARSNHKPEYIRRILIIGSALIREIDRGSQLGVSVDAFLQGRENRLAKRRKHPHLAMNAAAMNTLRQERQNVGQTALSAEIHNHGNNAPGDLGVEADGSV